jgi:hypothetical protein
MPNPTIWNNFADNTSGIVSPTQAVAMTAYRDVTPSDQMRRLYPNQTPVLSLVKGVNFDQIGTPSLKKGMLDKIEVERMYYEWMVYYPMSMYNTATGGSSSTFTSANITAYQARDTVYNATKELFGIVTAAAAGSVTVQGVGTAGWNAAAGDVIVLCVNTMEEGTSTFTMRTKEPTFAYNSLFPFRYAVTISDIAVAGKYYGGDLWNRYLDDNAMLCAIALENACVLGILPATGNTTATTIGGTAYNLFTGRGLRSWSANTIPVGGALDRTTINNTIYPQLPRQLKADEELYALMGRRTYGQHIEMANKQMLNTEMGEVKVFGSLPKKFYYGGMVVQPLLSDLFDQAFPGEMQLFPSSDLQYVSLKGEDVGPVDNIQLPATWGRTREIRGIAGIRSMSAGLLITKISDIAVTA